MDRLDRVAEEKNIILPVGLKNYLEELGKPTSFVDSFLKEYCALTDTERSLFIYELVGKKLYREYPVDIHTFIHDPEFMGTVYGSIIFPIWEEFLDEVYPAPLCKRYNECLISAGTRCFGKGTKIRMYDGTVKNVEDIKVGEQVMGIDSTPRTVKNLSHGVEELFKITPRRGGNPFICNKNHTLALRKIRDHAHPNKYENLTVTEYLSKSQHQKDAYYRIYHSGAIQYPEKDYLIDPYIFGSWLGDGHTASFRLTTADIEIKEAWENFANSINGFHCRATLLPNKKTPTWDISISRDSARTINSVYLDYIRANIKGHKRIPHEYMVGSIEQRLQVLAGILDTDGYKDNRSKKKRECYRNITTKYRDLAEDYANLARSLGFRATVHERNKKLSYVDKIYTSYDVNLTGDFTQVPCKLKRKQTQITKPVREWSISEFTIESIGDGEYFGFEIDGDHLFLLEDYTVVHNSGKSTLAILSALYEIYLLSCMINPTTALGIKSSATIVFALLSKDNATACSQLGADIHKGLSLAPVFKDRIREKLSFSGLDGNGAFITDQILLKAGSSVNTLTGTDLYFGVLDEANMPSVKIPAERLVETRINMYRTMIDRKTETFKYAPKMSGMVWLISSPMDEGDVIGERIDEVYDKNIPYVMIRDNIARWEARPPENPHDYDETFEFFLGSDTQDPCIIEETDIDRNLLDPERIINVPRTTEYYNYFKGSSVRTAIQEVAGRRTVSDASLFTSVNAFQEVFARENHIFRKDDLNIDIGNMNSFTDYMIDKEYFKHPDKPDCYRYIHLDIASKRDRFGISSVYSDRVKYISEDGEEISRRKYFIDFCLGISSAGKNAVDILKVLEWIYSLKKQGYPIKMVTTDSHQGELARQIIAKYGIKTEYLSVEKTTEPYYNLKNLILTKSLSGFKNPLLMTELRGLRIYKRGVNSEKVEKGKGFTDDLSDSLAGATWSCSQDRYYKKASESIEKVMELADNLNTMSIAQGRKQANYKPEQDFNSQLIQPYTTSDMNDFTQCSFNTFMSPWQNKGNGRNKLGNGY